MSGSINFQINKLTSALTFNYNLPNPGESPARAQVPTKSGPEVVNYSQINEANVQKCNLRGTGALMNLGNQMPDILGKPKSSASVRGDEFSEERNSDEESHPRHRSAGVTDEWSSDEDSHQTHRSAQYGDRRE